ncbi:MAG: TetR family transcriptional regulator [Hyphomicrobiales bacterium]|nr:MAG: TetR family transcriptional regulator [Hyphomicrobiales bacterium]
MTKSIAKPRRNALVRSQVLDAAVKLFDQLGYFNTSIPDIVAESGVSIGSIYHHFGDKEGVARALRDTLLGRVESDLEKIETRHETTRERCHAVIDLLLRLTENEPSTMAYMLRARHKEFLSGEAPICSAKPMARMRELISLGMAGGEVREMAPDVAAAMVYGPALRLIQLRLDGLIDTALTEYLDDIWEMSWNAVALPASREQIKVQAVSTA